MDSVVETLKSEIRHLNQIVDLQLVEIERLQDQNKLLTRYRVQAIMESLDQQPTATKESNEMTNLYQHKTENAIVVLLPETATNKYGKVLFWIRLENGNEVSIWEDKFNNEFQPA